MIAHHDQRCAAVAAACRIEALSVAGLLPYVFPRKLDEHQTGFAFGEVLAHVNYMLAGGELVQAEGRDGMDFYRSA